MPGPFAGLSVKLIGMIAVVIMAVAVLIYVPSLATFRANWLDERLRVGLVAARVLDALPDAMNLPQTLTDRLLASAGANAIVYRRNGQSQILTLQNAAPPRQAVSIDTRLRDPLTQIGGAFDTIAAGPGRVLRILGNADAGQGSVVEVLMPEAPLRREMFAYSRTILLVSAIIAAVTAAILYGVVSVLFIRPVRRLTASMMAYRQAPENGRRIIVPEARKDEIGIAERELAAMQAEIFTLLRQRRHLADLGLAVAKINHDLRNTLTSAQLLSDQVVALDDPKIQRLAPRLVTTLDRAIRFAQSVLDHGRDAALPPEPAPTGMHHLIQDAAFAAGLVAHPDIAFANAVPPDARCLVDPDQMTRVFTNILKNAREALEAAGAQVSGPEVGVSLSLGGNGAPVFAITDNGPGLPPRARDNLFVAFEGSARAGGTGLGLAIAKELVEAHGGELRFVEQARGTRFEVVLPQTATV